MYTVDINPCIFIMGTKSGRVIKRGRREYSERGWELGCGLGKGRSGGLIGSLDANSTVSAGIAKIHHLI